MVRVKVCGITRMDDARVAVDLGASALGFVFWPDSPRCIEPERVGDIVATLPPFVTPVGVFVDQPIEYVRRVVEVARLGAVQLHGRESAGYCRAVGHRILKAVTVGAGGPTSPIEEVDRDAMVLLDAHDPVRKGGTGVPVNWRQASEIAKRRPIILSGGLRPENVGRALAVVRPYGVDVSSGVEVAPGRKADTLLRAFFEAIVQAETRDRVRETKVTS